MSVLNQQANKSNEEAQRRAKAVKTSVMQCADQLIRTWNSAWDMLWDAPDLEAVLEELGADAVEIFELNDLLIEFLSTALAGRRQDDLEAILAKVALKPPTLTHSDGTSTLDL